MSLLQVDCALTLAFMLQCRQELNQGPCPGKAGDHKQAAAIHILCGN